MAAAQVPEDSSKPVRLLWQAQMHTTMAVGPAVLRCAFIEVSHCSCQPMQYACAGLDGSQVHQTTLQHFTGDHSQVHQTSQGLVIHFHFEGKWLMSAMILVATQVHLRMA